jgi:hypothetical protein
MFGSRPAMLLVSSIVCTKAVSNPIEAGFLAGYSDYHLLSACTTKVEKTSEQART